MAWEYTSAVCGSSADFPSHIRWFWNWKYERASGKYGKYDNTATTGLCDPLPHSSGTWGGFQKDAFSACVLLIFCPIDNG